MGISIEPTLGKLSELVADQMGLYFPPARWADLERGICAAARDFGYQDMASCLDWLTTAQLSRQQIEVLAAHLTVGETYFFREESVFKALREHILPELISQRRPDDRRLRIWSAGCASGEEPYSVAILLTEMLPDLAEWNITILATDINLNALTKASHGVYSHWSFRDCPEWAKQRYFRKMKDGKFEIVPNIKKMVSFSYLNLARDIYPSLLNGTNAMDIILCRNVLMYFITVKAERVIGSYYHCLTEGGWLITSPTEVSHINFKEYRSVPYAGTFLYRKDNQPLNVTPTRLFKIPEQTIPLPMRQPIPETEDIELRSSSPEPDGYDKAAVLYRRGLFQEAELAMNRWLSQRPTDARALAWLARIKANLGKLAAAKVICQQSIIYDKLNPAHHYLLATILQELGETEEAAKALKRALFLNPDFILARLALSNVYKQLGRPIESRLYLNTSLQLLSRCPSDEPIPEGDGITAGRLIEIIRLISTMENTA